jgi:N-acetylglutamate synthase-like GNAT family acetyltransferase
MNDQPIEDTRGDLLLSTDRSRIDIDAILAMLRGSHWAASMTRPRLERAIENSLCFAVYDSSGQQLGFARAVTDLTTYAYLTDVIVAESARGRGIGSWMVETVLVHPDLQGLRRIALWTRNARALYERFGFAPADIPTSTYLEIYPGPAAVVARG